MQIATYSQTNPTIMGTGAIQLVGDKAVELRKPGKNKLFNKLCSGLLVISLNTILEKGGFCKL